MIPAVDWQEVQKIIDWLLRGSLGLIALIPGALVYAGWSPDRESRDKASQAASKR
jgi:hypothetical protein